VGLCWYHGPERWAIVAADGGRARYLARSPERTRPGEITMAMSLLASSVDGSDKI